MSTRVGQTVFLGLLVLLLIDTASGAGCNAVNGFLNVTFGTQCEISGSIDNGNLKVYISGDVTVNNTVVVINCLSFEIYSTGTVRVDALSTSVEGSSDVAGAGGSHGGRGGSPANAFLSNGDNDPYGSLESPNQPGRKGGGTGAGNGGGSLTITALSYVNVDGVLTANGGDATLNGGGGSGGSLFIDSTVIKGYGVISARGGKGSGTGGGGGGGKISLKHTSWNFTFQGTTAVDGGLAGTTATDLSRLGTSASSTTSSSSNYQTAYGALGAHQSYSWRPSTNTGTWLQTELSTASYVTAIKTRGGPNSGYYVKKYRIKFWNITANAYVEPVYELTGNTDGSNTVTRDLPYPVFTNKVQVYPTDYSGGVELSMSLVGYAQGGPGGPGTAYHWRVGQASRVVIDNYGKSTYIPGQFQGTTCKSTILDVMKQGAAAYLVESSEDLKEIIIYDGSHVVVTAPYGVNNVIGDGRSMIHLANNSILNVDSTMTAHAHIYAGSTMVLSATATTLKSTIFVQGALAMAQQLTQELTLAEPAAVTINSTEMTSFSLDKFTVAYKSSWNVYNSDVFNLAVVTLTINGVFNIPVENDLSLQNISAFSIGSTGQVTFDPITSQMFIGNTFDIRGRLTLGEACVNTTALSFIRYTKRCHHVAGHH